MMSRRSGPTRRNTSAIPGEDRLVRRRPEIEGRREEHRLARRAAGRCRVPDAASSIEQAITPSTSRLRRNARGARAPPRPARARSLPTEGPSPVVPKIVADRQPRSRQILRHGCEQPADVDALRRERRHQGRADAEPRGPRETPAANRGEDATALTLTCYMVLNPLQALAPSGRLVGSAALASIVGSRPEA